jgi:hypothetical protein
MGRFTYKKRKSPFVPIMVCVLFSEKKEFVFIYIFDKSKIRLLNKIIMYILIVMNVKLIELHDEVIFIVQSLIYEHVSISLYYIISFGFLCEKRRDVVYIFYFFSLFL